MHKGQPSSGKDEEQPRNRLSGGVFAFILVAIVVVAAIVIFAIVNSSRISPEMQEFYATVNRIAGNTTNPSGEWKADMIPNILLAVYIFAALVTAVTFGMLCISLADKKGYNTYRYFWLGFFLLIVGLIYVVGLPVDEEGRTRLKKKSVEPPAVVPEEKVQPAKQEVVQDEQHYPTAYDYQRQRRSKQ